MRKGTKTTHSRPYALRKRSYRASDRKYDNPPKVVKRKRGRPRK